MIVRFRGFSRLALILGIVSLGFPGLVFAHGKALEKKAGGSAVQEAGPHGGAVIDIGDGHFELALESNGALSLYRLDGELKVIPAEDVDGALVYMVGPDKKVVSANMAKVGGGGSQPLHFSIVPTLKSSTGFMAVISVSMGEESQNLRFLVKGL